MSSGPKGRPGAAAAGTRNGKRGAAGARGGRGRPAAGNQIRLADHPRARRHIEQGRAWAGLGGFAIAALASWHAGTPFLDTAVRALVAGIVCYLVVWALAVQVWRHLAVAEVKAAEKRWLERRAELEESARAESQAAVLGRQR